MKQYLLPSEEDATRVVVAMSQLIGQHGYISVAEVNDLIGAPSSVVDHRNGWKTANHALDPAPFGVSGVYLEFPDPIALVDEHRKPMGVLRLTMEFDANESTEKLLTEFLTTTDLLQAATAWSLNRRPRGGPRVSYSSPISRGDDI